MPEREEESKLTKRETRLRIYYTHLTNLMNQYLNEWEDIARMQERKRELFRRVARERIRRGWFISFLLSAHTRSWSIDVNSLSSSIMREDTAYVRQLRTLNSVRAILFLALAYYNEFKSRALSLGYPDLPLYGPTSDRANNSAPDVEIDITSIPARVPILSS